MWCLDSFRPNFAPRPAPTGRAKQCCRTHSTIDQGTYFLVRSHNLKRAWNIMVQAGRYATARRGSDDCPGASVDSPAKYKLDSVPIVQGQTVLTISPETKKTFNGACEYDVMQYVMHADCQSNAATSPDHAFGTMHNAPFDLGCCKKGCTTRLRSTGCTTTT